MVEKKILEVRNKLKAKKPKFKRVQSNQFAKLKNKENSWRKPKGMGNKVRRQRRGQAKMPKVGYGSPREVKGLTRDGFRPVIVNNVNELSNINPKEEIVVISSRVGGRKKLEILNEIKSKKLSVYNVKDLDKEISSLKKEKKKKESKESKKKEEENKEVPKSKEDNKKKEEESKK
jgi:large subunit ribosomal protein L32e